MLKHIFVLLLLLISCQSAIAVENLALRKSYTYSPKPDYPLCADNLDAVQLTDGKSTGSQWTDKSTVGWRKAEPVVEIVIDLEQSYTIDQVRIHTVGGSVATVEFPEFAAVLLSEDGSEYGFAGLLSSKNLANIKGSGYRGLSRTLSVENINAKGRYVKLAIRPNGLTFFTDEIEILGQPIFKADNNSRGNLEVFSDYQQLLSRIEEYLQLDDNIIATVETLRQSRSRLTEQSVDGISEQTSMPVLLTQTSDAGVAVNRIYSEKEIQELSRRIGLIRAKLYKAYYNKPFKCIPANPMDVLAEKEMLLSDKSEEINIQMWQNEYESAALNVINCSDEMLKFNVSISPLLGQDGRIIDSDKTFIIRTAQFIRASQAGSIADALVLLDDYYLRLEPGRAGQLWFTVFNTALEPGIYRAEIAVSARTPEGRTLEMENISVNIKVSENRIPENIALDACNWAYYKVAPESETADDLESHYTNVYVIPAQDLPFLRFSSDPAGFTRSPDYSKLDNVLEQHKYARTYLIGLNFSIAKKDFGRFGDVEWMTREWKNVFSKWLVEMVEHLKDKDIGYGRFVLYPFDETIFEGYYELAKFIKQIDPDIRLYANTFGDGPEEFTRFDELIDVWCLQDSHCQHHPDWFETIKGYGKEIWTYECLRPMKAKEPYSYYRLLPWRAFKRGQTGAGFWTYYYGLNFQPGTVPWDDTLNPQGHSAVVYGADASPVAGLSENIIPSRRWQAWREGVEDYQYLYEFQQAINEMRIKDSLTAQALQRQLNREVDSVLENPSNSDIVYEAREMLSNILMELKSSILN
ncbi:glycoside hydrolase domain-containing protein [Planctomycetota bacterium]